jgi:CubicO group peptidase (beta-lactamase class C family)
MGPKRLREGAVLALWVSCTNAFSNAAAAQSLSSLARRDLERFADSVFQRYVRESVAPSLSVIIVRGDSVLLAKGYGLETEQGTPVSVDSTVFNVASLSKLFVATAVMQLVDGGRVRLDDPVANYLSGVAVPRTITLRHLVTHTSGLDSPFMRGIVAAAKEVYPLDTFFVRFPPQLGRPPGREIRYSNVGMSLAALVVERVAGEPFDVYAASHIFRPLGMNSSTFSQPPPPALDRRVATAGTARVPNALILYPSGSLMSTGADMSRFMRAMVGGATRLMSDSTLRTMQSRQRSANPSAPGVAIGFFESDVGGQRALFHTGARIHFSLMYLLPEQRVGIYLVHSMRQNGPFQSLRLDFVRAFVNHYFADTVTRVTLPPTARPNPRARRFAGTYRPVLISGTTIERVAWLGLDTRVTANDDGSLSVAMPGGPRLRGVELKPDVYRVVEGKEAGLTIAFSDTTGGPLTRMSLSGTTRDPLSFDRLRWYARGTFHAIVLVLAYVVIASCLPVLALAAIARRFRRGRDESPSSLDSTAIRVRRLAIGASVSAIAAPIVFGGLLVFGSNEADTGTGLRRALIAATTLLLIASLLALGVLLLTAFFRRQHVLRGWRPYDALIGIAGAVLAPLLAYYHVLGPWWL